MVRDTHQSGLCSSSHNSLFPEPRYASLPNIMKAKKKPLEKLTPADLGVDFVPRLETIKVTEPPKRVGGGKVRVYLPQFISVVHWGFALYQVENVDQLLAKLKEAGIIAKRG